MQTVLGTILFFVLVVVIAVGAAKHLDKPMPVRGDRGEIISFRTPEGEVRKGTQGFAELVASYEEK